MYKIANTILLTLLIGMTFGCGGPSGDVIMPDNPIPKPDNITIYGDDGSAETESETLTK